MLPIYLCRVGLKSTLTCRQVKEAQKPLPIYAVGGTISVFSYKKLLKFDKSPMSNVLKLLKLKIQFE